VILCFNSSKLSCSLILVSCVLFLCGLDQSLEGIIIPCFLNFPYRVLRVIPSIFAAWYLFPSASLNIFRIRFVPLRSTDCLPGLYLGPCREKLNLGTWNHGTSMSRVNKNLNKIYSPLNSKNAGNRFSTARTYGVNHPILFDKKAMPSNKSLLTLGAYRIS